MTSWARIPGLPWTTGEVKSALQKLIRRRDPRAFTAAHWMFQAGGQVAQALFRRLPIIAMEEGVPGAGPAAMELLSKWSRKGTREDVSEVEMLGVIAGIIGTDRDKDPTYLVDYLMTQKQRVAEPLRAFELSIKEGDAERAGLVVVKMWSEANALAAIERALRLIDGDFEAMVARNILRRARFGMMEGDFWVASGWVIAIACRLARKESGLLPVTNVPVPDPLPDMRELPWWGLDGHTPKGKSVLGSLRGALPYDRAFLTWFMLESDVVEGIIVREGWRGRFLDTITGDERAWWAQARPRAQQMLEELIQRERVGYAPPPPLSVKPLSPGRYLVASETQPGLWYNVVHLKQSGLFDDGWRCECPAFAKSQEDCKHIRAVKQQYTASTPAH